MSAALVLIDRTGSIDPQELADTAQALNGQLQGEVADEYDVSDTCRIGTEVSLPSEHPLYIVNSAQLPRVPQGALGWHDETESGYLCLDFCRQAGVSWSSCASHEAIEWSVDKTAAFIAQCSDGKFRALEPGDAVEQDSYVVTVNDRRIELSNFVLEAWFTGRGTKFDHLALCTSALELRPGGYISIYDPTQGWIQQQAERGMGVYRSLMAEAGHSRHAYRARRIAA